MERRWREDGEKMALARREDGEERRGDGMV